MPPSPGLCPTEGGFFYRSRSAPASYVPIATRVCNDGFRATGITAYLKNGGTLEKAADLANHSSTGATQLYDRRSDEVTLDEVKRAGI